MALTRLCLLLPVLVLGDPSICEQQVTAMFTAADLTAAKMLYFSGRSFDDLGDYGSCNEIVEANYVLMLGFYEEAMFYLGFCGPRACREQDYSELAFMIFERVNGTNYVPYPNFQFFFSREYNEQSMSGGAVAALIFILILFGCGIAGSVIDYLRRKEDRELGQVSEILLAFSFITNGEKIFSLPTTHDPMQVFNGLRVMCIAFICWAHCYLYQFQGAIVNPEQVFGCFEALRLRPIISAQYVVDIFFILSAFLLSYLTMDIMNAKGGRMNWKMFVVHRFIRIIPIYYLGVLCYVVLLRWIGSGAQWPIFKQLTPVGCDDYWWSNLLFLNNFLPANDYSCMGWTWYIANDMQFYLVSPILLILYYKRKLWGHLGCISLIAMNVVVTASMSAANDYTPMVVEGIGKKAQFLDFYVKPYTRCSTYFAGLMVGFMFRTYTDIEKARLAKVSQEMQDTTLMEEKPRIRMDSVTKLEYFLIAMYHNRSVRYLAYCIGLALILTVCYAPYDVDHYGNDAWSQSQKSAFLAFGFLTFGVGILLHLIPMLLGYNRFLSAFFSYKYMAPLARVSFAAYIFHPMLIYLNVFSKNQAIYIQDYEIFYHFLANVILAFIVGTVASLLVESPIMTLEKKIFSRAK